MYSLLPDYGDCQWYGLGIDAVLSQFAQKIYANFHKPSWQNSNRHLFMVEMPKKLLRWLKIIAGNGQKGDFKQERTFGWLVKSLLLTLLMNW